MDDRYGWLGKFAGATSMNTCELKKMLWELIYNGLKLDHCRSCLSLELCDMNIEFVNYPRAPL